MGAVVGVMCTGGVIAGRVAVRRQFKHVIVNKRDVVGEYIEECWQV